VYNQAVFRKAGFIIAAWLACLSVTGTGQTARWQSPNLNNVISHAMRGRSGSVVVLEVSSGQVLAARNLSGAARRLVRPGSTVKPFTLLAVLSNGTTAPSTRFTCRRKLLLAGHRLDCLHPEPVEGLDAITALAYSCNDYFTSMAARLRPEELQSTFLHAGLAGPSGLAPQEAKAYVGLTKGVEQLQLQAIGEENLRTTPLDLLQAYRELALRRRNGDENVAYRTVFAGLEAATGYGMARLAQPPGSMMVAGKTGTALADEGRWTHGWFVGFAPAERPEVVVVVFLEHGTGPSDAAPVAREIFSAYEHRGLP
jgi:cell division protein FtsI/penicillin-binding protein 2